MFFVTLTLNTSLKESAVDLQNAWMMKSKRKDLARLLTESVENRIDKPLVFNLFFVVTIKNTRRAILFKRNDVVGI